MIFPSTNLIKVLAVLITIIIGAGSLWYVTGLRADLAVSQENSRRMTEAMAQQQAAMVQMQAEQAQIRKLNAQLNAQIALQNRDIENLRERLRLNAAGNQRSLAAMAAARPEALERAVNRGTVNALRCLEIASGSPLTAAELAATKPSEINRECPSIANPHYKPAPGQ